MGGGVLESPTSIAEQRRVELVGLVAHDVHRLEACFLPLRSSCPRLRDLGFLLCLRRTGGRQERVVVDGRWSTDIG